ncbi:hypothetical protein D9Q98_003288 [Chlorella vulgaris]|uniref:CCR4-NOT transcription complex subunit 3 n=1 Tax=Chlorella vulgaris TaxID=3077 RepID=A0A9D4TSC1_CHLVU|nr:hypothetical protein D9Q98_003288 [Chlorella vulgaris]
MSSLRKLQQEIDKTLKKVQEGLEVFDDHQEQYDTTDPSNTNAREKLESQLKDQIKKLQRLRDSIKTWMTSSEIKDKDAIISARKEIERRMERFKLVEKEAKTKSFSKEGLNRAAADPKERAKADMRDWLTATVDTLNSGIEEFEAEAEAAGTAKKGKKPPARVTLMEESIGRHRQHIMRLEQLLRLLDNDAVQAEDVEGVKDLVDDYLDRNQDDFEEFAAPDDLYEELLDQLEGMSDAVVAAPPSHARTAKDKEAKMEKEREERERERQKAAAAAVKAQLAAQGNTRLAVETAHAEEEKKASLPVRTTSNSKSAAEAAVPAAAPAMPPPPPPPVQPPPPPPPARAASPRATVAALPAEPPSPAAASLATASSGHDASVPGTPVRSVAAAPLSPAPPVAAQGTPPPPPRPGVAQSPQFNSADNAAFPSLGGPVQPQQQQNGIKAAAGVPTVAAVVAASIQKRPVGPAAAPPSQPGASQQQSMDGGSGDESRLAAEASLDSLAVQLRAMGLQDTPSSLTPAQSLQVLQQCASRSIPQPADSQWQTVPQRPRAPPVPIPASYPLQARACLLLLLLLLLRCGLAAAAVIRPLIFETPALYEKLDAETLFFIFYNQPGSYQQYLAARELKRQAWRFHKQHSAWFQRHEEPKAGGQPGDDWEQGTYVYFDSTLRDEPGTGWCYRLKTSFMFEYGQLEDEVPA